MIITGIEVIRGNPGPAVEAVAPEKLELTYGDILRIATDFNYRGPAELITLYGAIGMSGAFGFDEVLHAEADYSLPASPLAWRTQAAKVDIPISGEIAAEPDYDLYVKIIDHEEAGRPQVDDVITIYGINPRFSLVSETIYPYAYVYDGDCDISIFTFKSQPFASADWATEKFAASCEAEAKKAGVRVLETRVYVDRGPLLWTDWAIEIIGTPAPATSAVAALAIPIWAAILISCLGLSVFLIVLTWSLKTVEGLFESHPISEKVKAAMSTETLILLIGDFETKLERPLTPVEEFEGKSDQELRDYCDSLAREIAPAAPSWLLPVIIGSVAVLGVGALALAMAKRREEKAK